MLPDFIMLSFNLKDEIMKAFNLVKQFHEREVLFGSVETPYPDLDDLDKGFKPFCDLISMASEVDGCLKDWTSERLMGQDANRIDTSIKNWH
jgi:hypothetical protein